VNKKLILSEIIEDTDLLSQVTIIILSKDRASDLEVVIDFWEQFSCPVIVLHETVSPLLRAKEVGNITYISCQESLFKRLELIKSLVKTPYSMLANDDEIYLPNGLRNIIKCLDDNPKIDSAGGQVCAYTWAGKKLLGHYIYKYLLNHSTLDLDCYLRIKSNFQIPNFMDLLSVYRTPKFLKIISHCSKFDGFTTPYMFEVMFTFFSSIYCQSIRVSDLYWVRNWHNNFHSSTDFWNRNVKWSNWYTENTYSLERKNWRDKLALELEQNLNVENSSKYFSDFSSILTLFNFLVVDLKENEGKIFKFRTTLKCLIRILLPSKYLRWNMQNYLPWRRSHVMKSFDKNLLEMVKLGVGVDLQDLQIFYEFSSKQR